MNDTASEYLNGNGNGSNGHTNGNGNGKMLTRADDPITKLAAPEARRRVCRNGKITHGARMFFCYVIDMALTYGAANKRGVYRESDGDLASQLKVSPRTIHNWKKEIASTGEVWITQKRMKNTLPETVYNFTCIVGQAPLPINADSEDGSAPQDEVFTSNRKRSHMIRHHRSNGRFICRLHGISGCAICRSMRTPPGVQASQAVPAKIEQNQPERKILPCSAEENCRPERKNTAVHHGSTLPQSTETAFRPPRKIVSVDHGNSFPQCTENPCGSAPKKIADNIETKDKELGDLKEGEGQTLPEKQFQDWLKTLQGMFPSKLRRLESDLNAKLQKAQSTEARAEWSRRVAAVRVQLLGGPVQDKAKATAKPVRTERKPTMSPEAQKRAWEKAKAALPAALKQKAATKAAART